MTRFARQRLALLALVIAPMVSPQAEPYLAVQQGYACGQCHLSATGGGLRTEFGNVFAANVLPARPAQGGEEAWSGRLGRFLSTGGNVRADWSRVEVPGQPATSEFDLVEARLYLWFEPLPGRLGVYVDERVAPDAADNLETYVRYVPQGSAWYARAGKFYLPFGLRLEDDSAFVRRVPAINMTTPDEGLELGWQSTQWSVQLALSNGSGGGAEVDTGKLLTGQVAYVDPRGRIGLAASFNDADAGDRRAVSLFGGLRTGPLAWLGEVVAVEDDGFPDGRRLLLATLLEANWRVRQGHNLKVSAEWHDPDDTVAEDEQTRWSLVYEYTPLPFLQLRAGARRNDGIPQNDLQNARAYFVQLHGFF
ncbi:MAG: hypothetical protein NDI84_03005 [Steroidobacteraceae bacterium]|nr:hypothetical protein [Steroidobacteraceae bacterium]